MIHYHGRKHKTTIPPHFYDPEALIISTSKLTFHAIEKVELADEIELDLHSIVECGDRWLVTFNVTKMKLFSFNHHIYPLLVPVSCQTFRFAWLDLYLNYGLESIYTVHCQGCFMESGLPLQCSAFPYS